MLTSRDGGKFTYRLLPAHMLLYHIPLLTSTTEKMKQREGEAQPAADVLPPASTAQQWPIKLVSSGRAASWDN